MKFKIFFTLIMMLYSGYIISQKQIITTKNGSYYKDSRLNDYIGTWSYNSGKETFSIRLTAKKYNGPNNISIDLIVGYHIHIKNTDTLQNTFKKSVVKIKNQEDTASITANIINKENILNITFRDLTKNKRGTARLKFINPEKNKAQWTLGEYEREQFIIVTDNSKRSFTDTSKGFSVPTNIILTKIED